MKWTTDEPNQLGDYWWKPSIEGKGQLRSVWEYDTGRAGLDHMALRANEVQWEDDHECGRFDIGWWYGPIVAPPHE